MTVNKYLLMLFCLLMLANITMIYDLQSGISQEKKSSVKSRQVAKDNSAAEHDRLTQLESRFDNLSAEITGLTQNLNRLAKASAQNSKTLTDSPANKQNNQTLAQAQVFADSIERVLELGVLDENAWQNMEQDIAAMSKEENKAFWTTMMAKIAQDEFVITDYEN